MGRWINWYASVFFRRWLSWWSELEHMSLWVPESSSGLFGGGMDILSLGGCCVQ